MYLVCRIKVVMNQYKTGWNSGFSKEEDCDTELKKHCEFVKVNETQLHICEEYEDCIPGK